MDLSCAVLIGGESRRMGRDKASIEFRGRPLVARIADRLSSISSDVFAVGKGDADLTGSGIRVYRDAFDVRTPLAGIATAMRQAVHPLVFVCATDMPYVSCELVVFLASKLSTGIDAVVPERDGRPEPLHAVWSTAAAPGVVGALEDGERAVHRSLERLHVVSVPEDEWRVVDPDASSFTNLNTPDELYAARD
jgi:molybdopterin-guanine dinucleotide biosynthesis protein A